MTDREKVARFIRNIKKAQQINGRWQIVVFSIMGIIALVYGNVKAGDLPRYLQAAFAIGIVWVITLVLSVKGYFSAYSITSDAFFSLLIAITNSFFSFVTAMLAGLVGKHIIEKEKWR